MKHIGRCARTYPLQPSSAAFLSTHVSWRVSVVVSMLWHVPPPLSRHNGIVSTCAKPITERAICATPFPRHRSTKKKVRYSKGGTKMREKRKRQQLRRDYPPPELSTPALPRAKCSSVWRTRKVTARNCKILTPPPPSMVKYRHRCIDVRLCVCAGVSKPPARA